MSAINADYRVVRAAVSRLRIAGGGDVRDVVGASAPTSAKTSSICVTTSITNP
jgi:hypothetical protein